MGTRLEGKNLIFQLSRSVCCGIRTRTNLSSRVPTLFAPHNNEDGGATIIRFIGELKRRQKELVPRDSAI